MIGRDTLRRLMPPVVDHAVDAFFERRVIRQYVEGGRIPWAPGYDVYRKRLIRGLLEDRNVLEILRSGRNLPPGHGVGFDERCIELPWAIAHLNSGPGLVLDAGSSLNHGFMLEQPILAEKDLHVLTLAPESECFWYRGVSYLFHDLRDIPMRSSFYDTVACISTLEHVGSDNTFYTHGYPTQDFHEGEFTAVMKQLRRVLKTGGTLLLTVPFGRYERFAGFQQFDSRLLTRAIESFGNSSETVETFYRYGANGWNLASAAECADCEYVGWINQPIAQWPKPLPVEPDRAAAARAVACVQMTKA